MIKRSSLVTLMLFALPAFTIVAGYTAYSHKINARPSCTFNCDEASDGYDLVASSKARMAETLDLIDQYRRQYNYEYSDYESTRSIPLFNKPTKVDVAFLHDKIKAIHAAYFANSDITANYLISDASASPYAYEENELNGLNRLSRLSNTSIRTSASDEIEAEKSRFEFTRQLNEFVFANNAVKQIAPIFLAASKLTKISAAPLNENIGTNFPNFNAPKPLAFSAPSAIAAAAGSAVSSNSSNNSFIVAVNQNTIDIDTSGGVNAVPLSPAQYFMILGLGFLLLMKSRTADRQHDKASIR